MLVTQIHASKAGIDGTRDRPADSENLWIPTKDNKKRRCWKAECTSKRKQQKCLRDNAAWLKY